MSYAMILKMQKKYRSRIKMFYYKISLIITYSERIFGRRHFVYFAASGR